jgi:catechol 2,3-dioxygenase-like lactoylglutathione lyase family enzyme
MEPGPRPSFSFGGRWLYCGDRAVVHFVETDAQPAGHEPRIEHFAFRARDYPGFVEKLERLGHAYDLVDVPPGCGQDLRQVFIRDPDGNRVEVTFDKALEPIE